MGMKSRNRVWIAWLANNLDSQDSEPLRIPARTLEEATALAEQTINTRRFTLSGIYTASEFYKRFPGWRGLV